MSMIGENSIAIIPNHKQQVKNADIYFPFRSNSDFYYLTGFDEPDAIAVFVTIKNQSKYILFCHEKDQKKELWDGEIIGLLKAVKQYGADDAYPISDIEDILPALLENKMRIVYNLGSHELIDNRLNHWLNLIKEQSRFGVFAPKETTSCDIYLHEMRLFKSRYEINQIKRAITATAKAHIRAMKNIKAGMMEYQLEAELNYEFNKAGVKLPAYPSIVAGGQNACTLHYTDNKHKLKEGDLVLIDAGGEYNYYAADVTRTFPVNGIFSKEQKDIYQIVLQAQTAVLRQIKPGQKWDDMHQVAVQVITEGLVKLGILSGKVENLIAQEKYKQYFMHRTSHWIGLDVHDVGDYKISDNRWRILEPNMVLTVEPGIYISHTAKANKKYHGIGIRIEDNVLVTAKGCEVLTNKIPRTIVDIEKTMAKK